MAKHEILVGKNYIEKVIPLINEAKKNIEILMFDWRWYKDDFSNPMQRLNHALVSAVRRGVSVACITNYKEIRDLLLTLGFDARKWPNDQLLHSKVLIIDREIVIMGSHNFTNNAFCSNLETSTLMYDPVLAVQYSDFFRDLCQSTK